MHTDSDSESGSSSSSPFAFTDTNHSALVAIVTIVASLCMLTVVAAKISLHRSIPTRNLFDFVLFAGILPLVSQTILTAYAARLGLGRIGHDVDQKTFDRILQFEYTSSLLAIVAVTCAKTSLCLVIMAINDLGRMFYVSRALLAFILLSSLAALFTTSFECPLPTPWRITAPSCPRALSIHRFTMAMDMLTDLALCSLAMAMVWALENGWKKFLVMGLFGSRILCPITLLPSLIIPGYDGALHYTWLTAAPIIWRQVSVNLSFITACIPSLKAVLDTFTGNTLCSALAPNATFELGSNTNTRRSRLIAQSGQHVAKVNRRSAMSTEGTDTESNNVKTHSFEDSLHPEYKITKGDSSESTRNLTDDVIHVREDVEIYFEAGARLSRCSSPGDECQPQLIWDGARGQHSWRAN